MNEWIALGAVFGVVFVGCLAIVQVVMMRRAREIGRLQAASEPMESTPDLLLGEATPMLAEQMPVGADKKAELSQEMMQAGFYSPTAIQNYAAIRLVLMVLPLFLAGVLALLVRPSLIPYVLVFGLLMAGLGYALPRVYVNMRGRARRNDISKGLPVAVDLLALGLLSGQNILAALYRVTKEIRFAFPALAEELEIVRQQAELNTLPLALARFSDRVQIPEVRNLVIILTQSQRQGTDIATALMEFVNNYRISLRQEADKQANQASFWLVFPSIFFLWLPAFAILVAPILFELGVKREQTKETVAKSQKQVEKLNSRGKQTTPDGTTSETPN